MTLPDDDLDWFAFHYLGGELSVDEVERFEARLDCDQAAREALASAVGLAGALVDARPAPAPLPVVPFRPRVRLGRRAAALLAAAACLAVVAAPLLRAPRNDADTETLALTWSGLWQDREPEVGDEPAMADEALVASLDELSDEDGPPPWMFEAASLGSDAAPGS